jgi:hypothetical protein
MRILLTSNPLIGHWLPMLPLARAAQETGHEVVIAAGPDVVPDIERRGFSGWAIGPPLETIQAGLRNRPRAAAESEAERTVADGMAMFADPAVARAHDLLDRTADWRPNVVVREIYELGGTYVPADLHVLHGLGAHYPNFVALAQLGLDRVRPRLGDPAWRVPMADTPYIDPFPPVLQPPDDQPFTDVIPIRPEAGELKPGDVLPERVVALPDERTVYLTLGAFFNAAAEFAVPLDALRELPVNVVLTCGFGAEPEAFEPLPPNVAVEQYVPQALLLPRCSAVVCHAGAGTIIGALAYGVPLVCLPRGADQFGNAAQISRIGAAHYFAAGSGLGGDDPRRHTKGPRRRLLRCRRSRRQDRDRATARPVYRRPGACASGRLSYATVHRRRQKAAISSRSGRQPSEVSTSRVGSSRWMRSKVRCTEKCSVSAWAVRVGSAAIRVSARWRVSSAGAWHRTILSIAKSVSGSRPRHHTRCWNAASATSVTSAFRNSAIASKNTSYVRSVSWSLVAGTKPGLDATMPSLISSRHSAGQPRAAAN